MRNLRLNLIYLSFFVQYISCYFVIKAYFVEYRTTHFYCLIYNFKVRTFIA